MKSGGMFTKGLLFEMCLNCERDGDEPSHSYNVSVGR